MRENNIKETIKLKKFQIYEKYEYQKSIYKNQYFLEVLIILTDSLKTFLVLQNKSLITMSPFCTPHF